MISLTNKPLILAGIKMIFSIIIAVAGAYGFTELARYLSTTIFASEIIIVVFTIVVFTIVAVYIKTDPKSQRKRRTIVHKN